MSAKKKENEAANENPDIDPVTENAVPSPAAEPSLEKQLSDAKELLLRTAAEYDNFKKRTERERESLSAFVKAQTVKQLLIPYDNLDRCLCADVSAEDYIKGVEMTLKQFRDAFVKLGVTEIGAVGDAFDPELHEAIMHIEDDNLGENTVSKVMRKGYIIGDTVLRHAMVEVAN